MPQGNCENGHYFNTKKDKVCPICGGKKVEPDEDDKILEELEVPPDKMVCGWLVCIKGINKGRAYEIHPGKNFIGRSTAMDICIRGDKRIEKKMHACLLYDEKNRSTFVLPGDSKGLVYKENAAIYEPEPLEARSVIALGDSEFQFIPFCDGSFDWNDKKET